jgi:hypothetical protein
VWHTDQTRGYRNKKLCQLFTIILTASLWRNSKICINIIAIRECLTKFILQRLCFLCKKKWLRERAAILLYTYILCLFYYMWPYHSWGGYFSTSDHGDPGLIPCHSMSRICGAPSTSVFPFYFQSSFLSHRLLVADSAVKWNASLFLLRYATKFAQCVT